MAEVAAGLVEAPKAGAAPEESEEAKRQRFERLNALGESLAKTRADAINARQQSGIEEEWAEDEDFYQGYDDANRHEAKSVTWRQKPPGQDMPKVDGSTRSVVFPNITGPFVDSAAARIADMLLPTDDRSWSLQPTPLPELVDVQNGKFPQAIVKQAAQKHPGDPAGAKRELALATQAALEVIAEAKDRADKAQKRIEDWLVECQWHANVRLVIEDAARIGTGVLKGPVPMKKQRMTWSAANKAVEFVSEARPGSKWINPWNFYPDGACGDSIHNGSYTWERDTLTVRQLRDLKNEPKYIAEQIDACIAEGPHRAEAKYAAELPTLSDQDQKRQFEVWYFHGTAEREDLEAAGCDCSGIKDPHTPALITMVNNRVIKAVLQPLDNGEFPYDVMVWRRRAGHWTGQGVGRQIRTPQRIITAAVRNLMDNAGIAAGPMLVFKQARVYPADGKIGIAPRKIWYIAEEADSIDDAQKAIGVIKVDMLVGELLQIVQLGLNLAEHVTGLPMLLQGQMGKAPDTLGGMQMLNNNASAVLRRLARLFDDRVTEPHIRRYYYYLLEYGEDDDEKGDYAIDARGSSALVERDLQNQAIVQMGNIILDPRFGKDPKRWMDEYLKANRLDPKRFDYDDEQWQQIVENMAKGPQDPRMAIEQMRAEMNEKLLMLEQQWQSGENERDRQFELVLADLDRDVKQAGDLAGIKARLADTVMKLRAQMKMQRDGAVAKQMTKPPVEPKGRAKPGRAFQH